METNAAREVVEPAVLVLPVGKLAAAISSINCSATPRPTVRKIESLQLLTALATDVSNAAPVIARTVIAMIDSANVKPQRRLNSGAGTTIPLATESRVWSRKNPPRADMITALTQSRKNFLRA